MELLAGIDHVHWLVLGVVLLVGELAVAGTTYLIWLAASALITGIVVYLVPMGWQVQMAMFSVFTVVALVVWRRYARDEPPVDGPQLNQRGMEHVGKVVKLEDAIVGGQGHVRLDDTIWRVTGADAPAGSPVRLIARDGNTYHVERAD